MLAHTDLAIVRLRSGALDAAITALQPVLTLRPGERTAVQAQRLSALRAELAPLIFRGSAQARELDEQVAEFAPAVNWAAFHDQPLRPGRSRDQFFRPTPPHRDVGASSSSFDSGRHSLTFTTPGSSSSSPSKNCATTSA